MITEIELQTCPVCGAAVIDDAWEDLEVNEDGEVRLNPYSAYVCEEHCGYVKEIHTAPNLFRFAKSELSQDAFFCWLFEHVCFSSDDVAQHVAIDLLEEIILAYRTFYPDIPLEKMKSYYLVKVEHQINQIDILLTLESVSYDEKVYIVIEDKINSGESRKISQSITLKN